MNSLLKNILFSLLAAIMLGLTGGISITKMQCSKGSKLFVGVENRTCHIQESNTCTKGEDQDWSYDMVDDDWYRFTKFGLNTKQI